MIAKKPFDVFPELLKQLADGLSIHTRIAARYWLALALVSAVTVIPTPQKNLLLLPFLSVQAPARDFYAFAFILISLLVIGYGSASCQGIRTRQLAQLFINGCRKEFLHPSGLHIQDVFDCIVSPSINRMAPLAQILQGKQQFFAKDQSVPRRPTILIGYFTTLRLVGVLAVYVFPGYALVVAFVKSSMYRPSASLWGIPVYLFWLVGIVAILVLVQSLCFDIRYFLESVRRIRNTPKNMHR